MKKMSFTDLVIRLHRDPAFVEEYKKNPERIHHEYTLTDGQGQALVSGIWEKIHHEINLECQGLGLAAFSQVMHPNMHGGQGP